MIGELGTARIELTGVTLQVTTGVVTRTWRLIPGGLSTVSFRRCTPAALGESWEWIAGNDQAECDFSIRGYEPFMDSAQLEDVKIFVMEDELGTGDAVVAQADFSYADANLGLRFCVYAYPGAPGIRTQIHIRMLESRDRDEAPGSMESSTIERLRIDTSGIQRIAAGYYNDTQHRNHDDTPILKEERSFTAVDRREIYDWANLLVLRRAEAMNLGPNELQDTARVSEGCILVKESHKCVNQWGLDTGAFIVEPDVVRVTGLGLNNAAYNWYHPSGSHSLGTEYQACWATWLILFAGDEEDAALALKQFDRIRFAPVPDSDRLIRANTWGTRFDPGRGARDAATEENVRREIDSCVDLGIEMLTIDAGWDSAYPAAGTGLGDTPLNPHPDRFPGGWQAIRRYAAEHGVRLGLHFGVTTPVEDLWRNFLQGGFASFKLDYGTYTTRQQLDEVIRKVRDLGRRAGAALRISWDLTENPPRIGYFLAREYGTLYPENRREVPIRRIVHVAYTPRLVLRDAWHFAHYLNLNQIEISVQDPIRIDPLYSNASSYTAEYCAAIALMALPLFMMETQVYQANARAEISTLLSVYKEHRMHICDGYIFPVGEEPCDESWTGFQSYRPGKSSGYLTVFREVNNRDSRRSIALHFIKTQEIEIIDLISNRSYTGMVDAQGRMELEIEAPGCFLFLRYDMVIRTVTDVEPAKEFTSATRLK